MVARYRTFFSTIRVLETSAKTNPDSYGSSYSWLPITHDWDPGYEKRIKRFLGLFRLSMADIYSQGICFLSEDQQTRSVGPVFSASGHRMKSVL